MLFPFLQTAAEAVEAVPVQEELSFSLISMAAKGGWLMLVLLALSIIAIYLFGKKWWAIRQAGKIDRNFIKDVDNYLAEGKVRLESKEVPGPAGCTDCGLQSGIFIR